MSQFPIRLINVYTTTICHAIQDPNMKFAVQFQEEILTVKCKRKNQITKITKKSDMNKLQPVQYRLMITVRR